MSVLKINTNEDYETYILNDVNEPYDYTCLILNKPYIVEDKDCFLFADYNDHCVCCICIKNNKSKSKSNNHNDTNCGYYANGYNSNHILCNNEHSNINDRCCFEYLSKNNIKYNIDKFYNKYCYLSLTNTFKDKEKYKNLKNIIVKQNSGYNYYIPILKNFNKLNEIKINFNTNEHEYMFFSVFNNNFINIKKLTIFSLKTWLDNNTLKYLNNLEYLEITNEIIDLHDLKYISKKCKQLKTLISNIKIKDIKYNFDGNFDRPITGESDIEYDFYCSIIRSIIPQLQNLNNIDDIDSDILENKIDYTDFDKYVVKNSIGFKEYYINEKLYKYIKLDYFEKIKKINDKIYDIKITYKPLCKYLKYMNKNLIKDNDIKIQNLQNNIKYIHKKNNFDDVFNISNLYVEYDFKQMKESKKELHLEFKYMYKYYIKSLCQKQFINDILN